jgi:hypothetical protein
MTRYTKCSGIILGIICYLFTCTALAQNTNQKESITKENDGQIDSTNKLIEIPFGTRSREELNFAQSSLRYNQLTKVPISNLSGLLAGRLSGFLFRWTGIQPGGGNVSYKIRGRRN